MLSTRTSPLLLLFSIYALNPFAKKTKDGNNGREDDGDDTDILVGVPMANGIPGSAQVDTKKYEEIEGNVNDIKDKIKTFESSNKSIKGELDGLRGDIGKMNGTLRQLLSVYEVVNREYNPFVEPTAKRAEPIRIQKPAPKVAIKDAKVESASAIAPEKTPEDYPYEQVILPDKEVDDLIGTMMEPASIKEAASNERGVAKMMVANDKDTVKAVEKAVQDSYYLMQLLKLVEFQLEKMYVAKVNGLRMDPEDLQNLDKWFVEFKRIGLR